MFAVARDLRHGISPRRAALAALVAWSLVVRAWSAVPQLGAGRFWDERYSLTNVAAFLDRGPLAVANGYHPSLSYLPQAVLLEIVGRGGRWAGDPDLVRGGRRAFTPLAYLLVRLSEAIFGALAVLWVAIVGRRLFDADVGLVAALLLAVVPWHIRQSALFKPDAQLVFLLILAFDATVVALRAGTWRRYAAAGAAVALAAATKYNGATIALPLAVGGLFAARRRPRAALGRLATAVGAGMAVFLLVDLPLVLHRGRAVASFGRTLRDYGRKGMEAGTGHLDLLGHSASTLLSGPFHGPLVGAVALAGLAWIGGRLRGVAPGRRRELAAFLSFPVGYVVLYASATTNPSAHNWLPLVPFTSIAAAFALVEGSRALRRRVQLPAPRALPAVAVALLVGLCLFRGSAYAYTLAVPTTWSAADRLLTKHLQPASGHRFILQDEADRFPLVRGVSRQSKPVLVSTAEARRWRIEASRMDAEVRLERGSPELPDARLSVYRFHAVPFVLRGPRLAVVLHGWHPAGRPLRLAPSTGGSFPAPADRGSVLDSFEVLVRGGPEEQPVLVAGGRRLPLLWGGYRGRDLRFVSPRAEPFAPGTAIRVEGVAPGAVRRVVARAWRREPGTR